MSLYLRNLLAHRQAEREVTSQKQANVQPPSSSQARIAALRRWNARRQAEAKRKTRQAENRVRDLYWPWWQSLSDTDRHRAWTLAELLPVFGVNRQMIARHLRLMGWTRAHRCSGNVWKAPAL